MNYRLISLLPVLSKILEKIVYSHIYSFMTSSNQLFISQYGFRMQHSCENAISELFAHILKQKSSKRHTLSLFLDLSKAFDTLDHKLLLTKLDRYGIRGIALKWFESYLESRSLHVKCFDRDLSSYVFSDYHEIDFGTPQGSCLGPLLFLIYTNDIYKHLEFLNCILFADDTTIYFSHDNINFLKFAVEHDLGVLVQSKWLDTKFRKIFFNANPKSKLKLASIKAEGIKIPFVDYTKFLGVWIDKTVDWDHHTKILIRKLKQQLKLLNIGKHLLNTHTKKILYYAQFYSHLKYGIILWGNSTKKEKLTCLQNLQDKALSIIFSHSPTLEEL